MNMEEKNSQVIFDKNAVEFVTVAAEFCGFMECVSDMRCRDFVDKSLKLLPLLYLKASLPVSYTHLTLPTIYSV